MEFIIPSSARTVIKYGDRYLQTHVISVYDKNEVLKNWWEGPASAPLCGLPQRPLLPGFPLSSESKDPRELCFLDSGGGQS